MVEEINEIIEPAAELNNMNGSVKPPPLIAMGGLAQQQQLHQTASPVIANDVGASNQSDQANVNNINTDRNYEIVTPQGTVNTSLEMVQLLTAASTNLAKLKAQQKETGEGNDQQLDAAVANQMALLIWLNCLARETGKKEIEGEQSSEQQTNQLTSSAETEALGPNVMQMVLDHEGKPEWKCNACEFRDNEQDIVMQHVRLAHGKKGPVSLVHAVHRCSVCGFAAGTKRHVQLHIETTHSGQGGIISRSEGQKLDSSENGTDNQDKTFTCRMCPFSCKKRTALKSHLAHHTPRNDFVFKCMFCPYYVATKSELFTHLVVHGMTLISSGGDSTAKQSELAAPSFPSTSDDGTNRHFVCDLCPFETRSRAKLMHHRQFHRPRGLPYSCPYCSYNVTRRHLLAQHLRIHGVSPTESLESSENGVSVISPSKAFSRSKSPSPSLTITPISSVSAKAVSQNNKEIKPESHIDPSCLPVLSNELTRNLKEIPLVWVSRDRRYYKMFKCRHCPHVNNRKSNIQEHEKMHRSEGVTNQQAWHSCQFCSYACVNAGVLSSHLKVHAGSMGICHAIVDQALHNEEQLQMLAGSAVKKALSEKLMKKGDEKFIYYCQHCPARFFYEKEVQIHSKFHNSKSILPHYCPNCDFGARDESQILAHAKVHTPEYQERTLTLMPLHPSAPNFGPISGLSVKKEVDIPSLEMPRATDISDSSSAVSLNNLIHPWLNSAPNKSNDGRSSQPASTSRFKCDQCPSTFSKLITLQYHQSLHSADNPYRCHKCTYAAKTEDGLQQHSALHEQADSENNSTVSSPSPALTEAALSTKSLEETIESLTGKKLKRGFIDSLQESSMQPPIKMKFIGRKDAPNSDGTKQQFKYYIEEQVPLSGVELLKRKTQIEKEMPKPLDEEVKIDSTKNKVRNLKEDTAGNPSLYYPLFIDKSSGRTREKRYKCSLCPSAFEKLDQYNVHINLHGSNYKYKCKLCDYSVKFYANFMMHSKRHVYHDKMVAQKKGLPLPAESQAKYEPTVGSNPAVEQSRVVRDILLVEEKNKENQFDVGGAYSDMTTAERQQMVLEDKKADAFKPKDEEDRKIYYCQCCPYANLRRDAVDSHSLRHLTYMGRGLYQCAYCDYSAAQPNFIKEHTKIHFRPFKYVHSEGYMRHDKLEVWSIISGDRGEDDAPKKSLVFSHEDGAFTPPAEVEIDSLVDPSKVERNGNAAPKDGTEICVDFRTADIVDAPSEFIISFRPGKSKSVSGSNGSSGKAKSSKHSKKARKKTKIDSPPLTITEEVEGQNYLKNDSSIDFHDDESSQPVDGVSTGNSELQCNTESLVPDVVEENVAMDVD